jgi:hypothetical protein
MPDRAATEAFIDDYRRTFESFDADAIAGHFAFPCQVATQGETVGVVSVPDVEAWRPQIERIVGAYRLLGVRSANVESLTVLEVTPGIAHARVRWGLQQAGGSPVYAFTASYLIVDVANGPRIVAIAHDETPMLMAAVARARGV